MTLSEITNYLQDMCHNGKADKEVIFESGFYRRVEIAEIGIFEKGNDLLLKFKSKAQKHYEELAEKKC